MVAISVMLPVRLPCPSCDRKAGSAGIPAGRQDGLTRSGKFFLSQEGPIPVEFLQAGRDACLGFGLKFPFIPINLLRNKHNMLYFHPK